MWLVACKQTKGLLITDHAYRAVLDLSDRVYLLTGQGQTKLLQEPLVELRQLGYLP
jgi:ABC-type lipopolysaccharide export system ATPase subunit